MTSSYGGQFGLEGGINYELNETSSLDLGLGFGTIFANSYSGDTKDLSPDGTPLGGNGPDPWTSGGAWGLDLNVSFTKATVLGNESLGFTTVKVSPNLNLNLVSINKNTTLKPVGGEAPDKQPSDDYFTLSPGIDLGIQYQYQKIALYSGAGITCFTWNVLSHAGGKEPDKSTDWAFTGIEWDRTKFSANQTLAFGMTFAPVENLVIGAGISTILSPLFGFNLETMTFRSNYNGGSTSVTNTTTAFDLTVSYKFSSTPREPKPAKAKAPAKDEAAEEAAE
jgi:hypothetical protein